MHIGKVEIPVYHLELVRDRSIPLSRVTGTLNTAEVLHAMLDTSPVEQFVVIYLNSEDQMIGAEKIAMGDLEKVAVSMKNVFRGALLAAAPQIILGHNHPHGRALPSDPDLMVTTLAIQIGAMLGIDVRDHVIVSPTGDHYSMWDNQHEMVRRISQIAVEKHLLQIFGSHPMVDPLVSPPPPAIKDFQRILLDKLASMRKPI